VPADYKNPKRGKIETKDMPEHQTIGSGFTEGELKFASFWVRYRATIRKSLYSLLIALNALFWGYALWGIVDAYAISYPRESRITQEIEANALLLNQLASNRPRGVQARTVSVFQGTDGRLDMVVPITNPNAQWYAEFTYRFNVSGELTPKRSGFVLPRQERYLGEFGFAPEKAGGRTAVLTVDDIRWKRLDPSVVGDDYGEWISRRDAFEISDVKHQSGLSDGNAKISRTSFTFKNPTAYGYWDAGLYIILKRGDAPAAANYVTLSNVIPGDVRDVAVDWYETLPAVSGADVLPVVNFLDQGAYLPSTRF
jgi:hypothetical protein